MKRIAIALMLLVAVCSCSRQSPVEEPSVKAVSTVTTTGSLASDGWGPEFNSPVKDPPVPKPAPKSTPPAAQESGEGNLVYITPNDNERLVNITVLQLLPDNGGLLAQAHFVRVNPSHNRKDPGGSVPQSAKEALKAEKFKVNKTIFVSSSINKRTQVGDNDTYFYTDTGKLFTYKTKEGKRFRVPIYLAPNVYGKEYERIYRTYAVSDIWATPRINGDFD